MQPLIYQPNSLAYPGGPPGFDPTHPAAQGISPLHGFSGIASGSNFLNLLTGKPAIISGAPAAVTLGNIGPTAYTGAAGGASFSVPGQLPAIDARITIAGIFLITSFATVSGIFSNSSTNAAWRLVVRGSNSGLLGITAGGVADYNSNITLLNNVPYYVMVSVLGLSSGSVANYLVRRLDTGQIYTNVGTAGAPTASNGTYLISSDFAAEYMMGYNAAVMVSPVYLPMPTVIKCAQRPWDFWRPGMIQPMLFSGLRSSVKTAASYVQGRIIG